ncbi:MAG: hypothetical protein AAF385_11010 [Pseudomonadota bacterium]
MERKIAVVSIVLAIVHFVAETVWHFAYGQFLPMLIVDYIAIGLLVYAGIRSLQTNNAAGLLCGAWGFTFCLNYRTFFWRLDEVLNGNTLQRLGVETTVLGAALFLTGTLFLLTLILCHRISRMPK